MYKVIVLLFLGMLGACSSRAEEEDVVYKSELISDNEVYFFTLNGCPHCMQAKAYLAAKYPNLKLREREISDEENRKYFYACGAKFGMSKWRMGAPLLCMGQNYILGWDKSEEARFDEYIKPFMKKKKKCLEL